MLLELLKNQIESDYNFNFEYKENNLLKGNFKNINIELSLTESFIYLMMKSDVSYQYRYCKNQIELLSELDKFINNNLKIGGEK